MRYSIASAALLVLSTLPVRAGDADGGCEKFPWPVACERVSFASLDKLSIVAGEHLTSIPAGAFVLRLHAASRASFATPPERTPKSEAWFGGAIWFPAVEQAGIYQVTPV